MSDTPNRMTFPETPDEMHLMLKLEDAVKREHSFTHAGMNGYVIFEFLLKEGGENRGTIARGISQPSWNAEGNRSIDNAGV